jgi:hypothetical protein
MTVLLFPLLTTMKMIMMKMIILDLIILTMRMMIITMMTMTVMTVVTHHSLTVMIMILLFPLLATTKIVKMTTPKVGLP